MDTKLPDITFKRRVLLTLATAAIVDGLQVPLLYSSLNAEATRGILLHVGPNAIATVIVTGLFGFSWLCLPVAVLELVPIVNLAPLWTCYAAFLLWRTRKAKGKHGALLFGPAPETETVSPSPTNNGGEAVSGVPVGLAPKLILLPRKQAGALSATEPIAQANEPKGAIATKAESSIARYVVSVEPPAPARLPDDTVTSATSGWMRSKDTLVVGVLILLALGFALWLFHGLHAPSLPRPQAVISNTERLTQAMIDATQRKIESAQERCDDIARKFARAVQPGPKPDPFWHPLDYSEWEAKAIAWNKAQEEFEEKSEEARRAKQDAEDELRHLRVEFLKLSSSPQTATEIKSAWAQYVVPPLHFLFAFSLCRFSARSVFRFMLLKDRIGAIRL